LQKSLDACREKNLDVWRPIPSSLLGLTCMLLGRADEGLRLLGDGVLLTDELGVKAYLALWTAHLGEGLLVAGQVERARTIAQRALELAVAHKERGHEAWALRLLGDIAARAVPGEDGSAAKASGYYAQSLALAEELGMRPLIARNHLGMGRLYRQDGDRAHAEEHLATASTMLSELDMRFWFKRAAEELMALGHLFIVARHNVQLYEYLKDEFSGEPVTVILDRRQGERRRANLPHGQERRTGDRRAAPSADEAIQTRGFVVISPAEAGAEAPRPGGPPDS